MLTLAQSQPATTPPSGLLAGMCLDAADGNRTGQSVTQRFGHSGRIRTRNHTYTYDTASNRLLSVSGHGALQYSYLSNGDLSSETGSGSGRSFLYDARNRFSSFINQGMSAVTTGYETNAIGERVQKSGGGDDDGTDFIYDEQGHLIAEGHDGHISREYIYLGSLPVAELDHHKIYYIHASHLGAPQKMTDARQRIVWDRIAEPFGQTFAIKGGRDLMNLRFPGQYHDAESGLDYNGFRSYDPATGRYTQSDPIGLLGGINTYAYTGGNPVRFVDPSGRLQMPVPTTTTITTTTESSTVVTSTSADYLGPVGVFISTLMSPTATASNDIVPYIPTNADTQEQQRLNNPNLNQNGKTSAGTTATGGQCTVNNYNDLISQLEQLGGGTPRFVPTPKGATQFIFPNGTILRFDISPGQYRTKYGPHINLEYNGINKHIPLK